MQKRLVMRLIVGLCCALVALAVTAMSGEAGASQSDTRQEGPVRTDCQECHESVVEHQGESAHGQAASDPVFQEVIQQNA